MDKIASELLVERLAEWGVDTVFGLPGDGINGMEGLHQYRRLRIRWERRADIHESFLKLAVCLICWRRLHRSCG